MYIFIHIYIYSVTRESTYGSRGKKGAWRAERLAAAAARQQQPAVLVARASGAGWTCVVVVVVVLPYLHCVDTVHVYIDPHCTIASGSSLQPSSTQLPRRALTERERERERERARVSVCPGAADARASSLYPELSFSPFFSVV